MDGRTTESSMESSVAHSDFSSKVLTCDHDCIVTGTAPGLANATHIIPHSKGNKYIAKLHPYRHINLQPPSDDFNDVRNGLLLYCGLHRAFVSSTMAFLRTRPHFAMVTVSSSIPRLSSKETRVTMQYFREDWKVETQKISLNSDTRLDLQSKDAPTPLLLDLAYGCAALKKRAESNSYKSLKDLMKERLYGNEGGEIDDDDNGSDKSRSCISGVNPKRARRQKRSRKNKANKQSQDDGPTIQEVLMTLWFLNAKEPSHKNKLKHLIQVLSKKKLSIGGKQQSRAI